MGQFAEELARYTGEDVVWTTATTGSPYKPPINGRLIQLKLIASGEDATSLIEEIEARVGCSLWPVDCMVATAGAGIRTAPAFPIPIGITNCDLPVKDSREITIEFRHHTGDTPVTANVKLLGVFETGEF